MSGFKRYQSKVFWSQMESQDVGNVFPTISPNLSRRFDIQQSPRSRRAIAPMSPRLDDQHAFSLSTEENLDSVPESDTTDPENITVIHIEMNDSPANKDEASGEVSNERPFSPASRGQRSQDSGFSDSGRSDSSSGPQSPHRRRRRSRRSSRRRNHPRLASLRDNANNEQALPQIGPAHTSTPKQESKHMDRIRRDEVRELSRQLDFSLDGPEKEAAPPKETLNDFLYENEPAEQECDSNSPNCNEISRTTKSQRLIISQGLDIRAPVKIWLEEIRSDCEDECMATLQSKSLPRRKHKDEEPESRDLRLLTASATSAAKKVIDKADKFDKLYQRVLNTITNSKHSRSERELLQSLEEEASDILVRLGSSPPKRIVRQENSRNIAVQLGRLKYNVDRALDYRLDFYIEKVVRGLEDAPRESGSAARGALAALTALGLAGPRAGASVARCSGIRALLTSLISSGRLSSELRSASLRALASVCCCIEAIDQFVHEDGPEILTDVLAAESTPESEKSEAAALLVQITAPWMDRVGLPYVERYGETLVKELTELAERTNCKQTLLLATAGLNHLSCSKRCIGPIIRHDSIKKLLRCVKKSNGGNVWLMEQVASLIGQVARIPQARAHLVETRASVALVCFLRMQPPGSEDEYRRLEATARDALTRLCVEPEIAKQVVAVNGSNCLPQSDNSGQSCKNYHGTDDQAFKSTKSLRVARKIAAEQIDIARIYDSSPR